MARYVTRKQLALDGVWCSCCQTVKTEDAFYKNNQTGKRQGFCIQCRLRKARERYLADPEKYKQRSRKNYEESRNEHDPH